MRGSIVCSWMLCAGCATSHGTSLPKVPATRRGETVDVYFGTRVADPYRWLEDDNSAETKAWVAAQNRATMAYLDTIPERKVIHKRLSEQWNYEKYALPLKRGSHYFYGHNSGLQNQFVLYVTEDLRQPGRVLLDPNQLSQDGTVAVVSRSFTDDGRWMAYALSEAGSDWQIIRVRDVRSGRDLGDEIRWAKFTTAAWLKDGSGFFYGCFDPPKDGSALTEVNRNQKIALHRLGTPQQDDVIVYERQDQPEWTYGIQVSDDGRWLQIGAKKGTHPETALFLKDLRQANSPVEPLLDRMDATYWIVDNDGDTFYVGTDQGAPRGRLVAIQRGQSDPGQWKELIPQSRGRDVLDSVSLVGGQFVAFWMKDAHTVISLHDLSGQKEKELDLPGLGSASGFFGKRGDTEAFYEFSSFTHPNTIYRYDFANGQSEVFRAPGLKVDPAEFVTEQVFYPSKDGTMVPMFIVHRKDLVLDGQNPTLLTGYGGFNISMTPSFYVGDLQWVRMGGIFVMANLRGGGEYGLDWYNAGRLAHKQNVFDDFIAAAEWLLAHKYTSPSRLAIQGGSNGGLLVAACLTQRPDLFGAAVPRVGVMDMLRFHKFTIGWAWTSDYGSSDTNEGFDILIRYSPLHAIRPGTRYPATLIVTSDHDDRVVPAHSHKFTATLQAAQAGPAPILTRIEIRAGHGAGKPTDKMIHEQADIHAFLVKALGIRLPPGFR